MPQTILLCSAPHAGTLAQVRAIAEAYRVSAGLLDAEIRLHRWQDDVAALLPRWLRRRAPSLLISCARSGERKARRQKQADPSAFWVHVEALKQAGVAPDLLAVPRHDWLSEMDGNPAIMPVLGAPHGVRAAALAASREAVRMRYGVEPARPVSIFLIGGPNPAFDYDAGTVERILEHIAAAAYAGHRCFVSASRRTPPILQARLAAPDHPGITVWDGVSTNPYRDYLAMGDQFLVTEDSITMTCEAVATGRQVCWLKLAERPGEALAKFRRFHRNWSPYVLSEPRFPGTRDGLISSAAESPDDTGAIVERMLQLMTAR